MASSLSLSVDETVSLLKHSCLPTLLVEGASDKALLRMIEGFFSNIDLLPVDGKDRLREIYARRSEYEGRAVAFLHDRDEWVVLGIPGDYQDMIFTSGYSIENDVLCEDVVRRLSHDHWGRVTDYLEHIAAWFRHALVAYCESLNFDISRDVSHIYIEDSGYSDQAVMDMRDIHLPKDKIDFFSENSLWTWLRGKTLLRSVHCIFCECEIRYSKAQLLELSLRMGPSAKFIKLVENIRARFYDRYGVSI